MLRSSPFQVRIPQSSAIPSREQLLERVDGARAILSLLTETIDAEVMDRCPQLRVISNCAVGYNNIQVDEATRRGVAVCITPGVLTETTADFTWALILAASRRVVEGDRFLRAGHFHGWDPLMLLGRDLHGATLGLVGFGRIGQAVARRAVGFSLKVQFYSPRHPGGTVMVGGQACYPRSSLEELLESSDVVSLHVPLRADTHHLIGARQLAMMKREAVLVNTSRGPVVDEAALAQALAAGHPSSAALDVYEHEPEVHPALLQLENVVLAPHLASASVATRDLMATMAAKNLLAVLGGHRPERLVNPEILG